MLYTLDGSRFPRDGHVSCHIWLRLGTCGYATIPSTLAALTGPCLRLCASHCFKEPPVWLEAELWQ